jgi:hypothetical protein
MRSSRSAESARRPWPVDGAGGASICACADSVAVSRMTIANRAPVRSVSGLVSAAWKEVAVLSLTSPADQSMTAPPVMLISLAVIVRAQSDAANVAALATSS